MILLWKDTDDTSNERFFGIIKTVISFAQVLSFPSGRGFFFQNSALSDLFHDLTAVLNTLGLRVFSFMSLDCLFGARVFTFYVEMLLVGYAPLILVLLVVFFFYLYWRCRKQNIPLQATSIVQNDDALDVKDVLQEQPNNTGAPLRLVLFIFLLLYPHVSTLIAQFFQCQHIDKVFYLISDYSLKCFDDAWRRWLGSELLLLVLYPLGGPLAIFLLLKYKRDKVNVRFLTAQYQPEFYYWDV